MMRMETGHLTGPTRMNGGGDAGGAQLEVRPGGMLVQKRNPDFDRNCIPPPLIRVRVKYGSTYQEVNIGSQATFGELKKILSVTTGLHHQDQKLFFKNKERDSKAFLDVSGVKDKSKIVLVEDPISQEKRLVEMRKSAKMEKASKCISDISLEVDRLAGQLSGLESVISKGGKVPEKSILNLIELLMNQLLKLDGIIGEGDVKLERKKQVTRVQKYVETLDALKVKNAALNVEQGQMCNGSGSKQHQSKSNYEPNTPMLIQHHLPPSTSMTTQWETFDFAPILPITSSTSTSINHPKFSWDFFN